jgi:sulfur carrier protein
MNREVPKMIEVQINGERREIRDGGSVAALLDALGVPKAVAVVERNGEVVPRSELDREIVTSGDRIEIVRLMGGG